MKKRIISVVAAICVVTAAFAGCGKKEASSVKTSDTVKIFTELKNRPDCALVSQELSKLTKEKIGVEVEVMFGFDQSKIDLMLASNEQMDVGFDKYVTFVDRARANAYVDITDMVKDKAPALYSVMPEKYWEAAKIDGKLFAVPTYKDMVEQWTLLADSDVIEENNIDISKIDTLKDAEVILEALKKDSARAGYEILPVNTVHMNMVLKEKYDVVYGEFVIDRENPDKILHFMQTPDYKEYVYMMRDWYKKGYIAKDIATLTDYNSYHDSGNVGLVYTQYQPYSEISSAIVYNTPVLPIHITPAILSNYSVLGSVCGIYSKSKNVDSALKFIELLNTDSEVKNLYTYGIEGKHYDLVDGKVKIRDGAYDLYKMHNAGSGNNMISYLLANDPDDKYEKFVEFNESGILSPALGFIPDTSAVNSKIGACANVLSEYNPLLCCGAVEPDK